MRQASRRSVLAAALLALCATSAFASNKLVDARKVFPFLEGYLKLPPAERSRFKLAYYFHIGPQPLSAPVWIVEGAARTAIPLRADGLALKLPTADQLANAKAEVGIDADTKLGVTLGIEATLLPAADMDAREVAAALAQAALGQKKVAGVMALAMPKLKEVSFIGVPTGEVEFADGRRAPLPVAKGAPVYNPETLPNARRLRFPKPPTKLDMG